MYFPCGGEQEPKVGRGGLDGPGGELWVVLNPNEIWVIYGHEEGRGREREA